MEETITILGIDPSLTHFGYALGEYHLTEDRVSIIDMWQVDTEPPAKGYKGYKNIWDYSRAVKLSESLQSATSARSAVVAVEMPHGSQSARACVSYGVCLGVLSQITLPTILTRERDAKILATGKHKAEKSQMISTAYDEYPDLPWRKWKNGELQGTNEHMADAIWAIKTCVTYDSFKEILEKKPWIVV